MPDQPGNSGQRVLVISLIFIGLVIIGFFGWQTARAFRQFHGHRPLHPFATPHVETDVNLIRDWMTIPFISRMYLVPSYVLFEALGIPERGNREKSLRQLNEEYYPEAEGIVLEKIKAAVRLNQPRPIPTMTATPVGP